MILKRQFSTYLVESPASLGVAVPTVLQSSGGHADLGECGYRSFFSDYKDVAFLKVTDFCESFLEPILMLLMLKLLGK